MKRYTKMLWAAVAVLGLYTPMAAYAAGPFGSKGGFRGGNSSGGNSSAGQRSMGNSSAMKFNQGSLGSKGSMTPTVINRQPMNTGNFGGKNVGGKLGSNPVLTRNPVVMPGGSKTPIIKPGGITPINNPPMGGKRPFPGGTITPIKDPIRVNPFPGLGTGGKKPFPGGTPILDPIPGGGKKPGIRVPGGVGGILDPFPGGKPGLKDPIIGLPPKDPFPGGGNNPPGGGNNPPGGGNNPPGGGNNPPGGGNNPPGGGGHHDPGWGFPGWGYPGWGNGGCFHGGGRHCWPNYCLNWCWPTYYVQPYCGTVYVNGCWTYVTQPVAVEQISLVTVGDNLPEIPSNATFKMQVSGLGAQKGIAAVEVNGVGMQVEMLEWNSDSVVVRLPALGLTDAMISDLYILQADGSMAKNLKFKMLPGLDTAVASVN